MLKKFTAVQATAILLFLGLSGIYISLSPSSIAGQGYTGEEIDSGLRMLSVTTAWLKGHPAPPMIWSRHGPLPVLFDLPFLKLGKHIVSPDYMLSFQPGLITAGLVTILFLWLRKICSPGMGLFLTLTAAFGTMLWPYAYISLETKQSFFLLLAGFLALADGKIERWPRLLLFAAACGMAISTKGTGITLWPVIAYLIYVQFRCDWRSQRVRILTTIAIIVGIWAFSHWGTNAYWDPRGGGGNAFRQYLIESPIEIFINVFRVFASANKGLLVYSPVLIACIYAVPRAFRTNREVAIFALLVVTCTLALMSVMTTQTDETWGCRYMHLAIAPLVLCIGVAWPRFRWFPQGAVLVLLAVLGLVIALLGAFYYYGIVNFAMKDTSQNTMEWTTGDYVWNPITFHSRLFRVWLHDSATPVLWTPKHIWVWAPQPDAMAWKSIDLRQYCQPQSFMLRFWHVPKTGVVLGIFVTYVFSLVLGVLMLVWVVVRTVRDQIAASTRVFVADAMEVRTV